ncbi:hypothetical protein J437_LFUL000263 [Ladona fulva]|uniref:FHA domain-containing protein n=1 Tax=Ladona fulva TaxID=123851 RepID=A0A8K0JV28_LADFU|nr:hypothetical protein J437_LFUL000263 [Ladona fulva]
MKVGLLNFVMDNVLNERKENSPNHEKDSREEIKIEDLSSEKKDSLEIEHAKSSEGIDETFKKPLTIESKAKPIKPSKVLKESSKGDDVGKKSSDPSAVPVPYLEPAWSSTADEPYTLEVIKSGTIIDTVDISRKLFLVFGRQSNCDVQLAHPTISRHHAVIQQCGSVKTDGTENESSQEPGIYIYDLGSTHGTFVNKILIPKQKYIRLHVGHIMKFGGSTRSYVLIGPESDAEKESDKSVTELKKEAESRRIARITAESAKEVEDEEEDKGIDWGFGEDADEESDLAENPFAVTQNEELYIDDPKKTLRGWFEREGEELEYDVEEKGFGQFLCQVKLPLDDSHGRQITAEALVKGKKKEAVVQCALEACRILDRMGLLRQATHESKKRKARNWEEDDFYDSDEDTFLDRTGTVERKREKRMRSAGKLEVKAETYDSLLVKLKDVTEEIKSLKGAISCCKSGSSKPKEKEGGQDEEDALDVFMSTLSSKTPLDKINIKRQKARLAELEDEEVHLQKLVKIACPATLPAELSLKIPSEVAPPKEPTTVPEKEKVSEAESSESKAEKKEKPLERVREERVGKIKEKPKREEKKKEETVEEEEHVSRKASHEEKVDVKKKEVIEENVSLWLPPENQTGDGKTKLNEKYGY